MSIHLRAALEALITNEVGITLETKDLAKREGTRVMLVRAAPDFWIIRPNSKTAGAASADTDLYFHLSVFLFLQERQERRRIEFDRRFKR